MGAGRMNRDELQNYREETVAIPWRSGTLGEYVGTSGASIARRLGRDVVRAWAACGVFEWIAFGYLAISSALIAVFAHNLAHPWRLAAVQSLVAAMILSLCSTEAHFAEIAARRGELRRSGANRFWHFWRCWYPHLFFLFCFEEIAYLVHLVYPGWYDANLIAFDVWLTGVNPALWLERFAHPLLNEFMQFAYFTYFVYLLILGGILYYRRDWRGYWAVMSYSAAGYVLGYVIAVFFPVQSPWFTLAGQWHAELAGGPFTALIAFIEKCGRVHGAAFPSQHVAGAFAALWGAWSHRRWLFWVFLPFVLCMCVSTVYVRNHYVADVLGGICTGTLGYLIGGWLMRTRQAMPRS